MKQLYLTVCAYVDLWLTMDISTFFFFIKKINCKHLRMDFLEGRESDELFCLNRQRRKYISMLKQPNRPQYHHYCKDIFSAFVRRIIYCKTCF